MADDTNTDGTPERAIANTDMNGVTDPIKTPDKGTELPNLENDDNLSEDLASNDTLRTPSEPAEIVDTRITTPENAEPTTDAENLATVENNDQGILKEMELGPKTDNSVEIGQVQPEAPNEHQGDIQSHASPEKTNETSNKGQKRRRRRVRPSHRTWNEDLMPYGELTGLFDDEVADSSDSGSSSNSGSDKGQTPADDAWSEALFNDEDLDSMLDDSPARLEWLRRKREQNEENEHLDRMMSMVGHEQIKAHFLAMKDRVDIAKRWKEDFKDVKLDLILHGNDGTGKRMIAWLYAEFLYSIGAILHRKFERLSGYTIEDEDSEATITFFDSADGIDRVSEITDILEAVQKRKDPAVLIFSYRELKKESMEALKGSPESLDRLPKPLVLNDYSEDEMAELLNRLAKKRPEFEGGPDQESILRLLARTIRQRREHAGEEAFSNIHRLERELDELQVRRKERQRETLMEWMKNNSPVDGVDVEEQKPKPVGFKVEDVLGPEPSDLSGNSTAWKELQSMIGLESVKKEVNHILNLATLNRQRERQGKDKVPITLNRCLLGEPGVGKTTVAKLYGQILTELGLLSKGNVIIKTPDDLIGPYIGHSEKQTKEVLEEAKGNLLIIDDAHMLYQSSGHGTNKCDTFRIATIDTLVANISGTPGADMCVLLCGYPDKMKDMFLNSNPGLQRRFPLENALVFNNYDDTELCQILDQKIQKEGLSVSESGRNVALEVLSRMSRRPRFGNAGDVESLLSRARLLQVERLRAAGSCPLDMTEHPLEAQDFDPDFDRSSRADKTRQDLFEGFVGFEKITEQFRSYQKMADGMRRYSIDPRPHIPWAFVFKGPPGTGKTSTAGKVGRLFYDMGLISSDEVITCSVTDLIGEYVGQTGPKVINQFEMGLGKVLFIDEAYRLNEDKFHKEAVGEIADAMTRPRYAGNMVVILAGYGEDMEKLLQTNQGLRSRFPTHITFPHMTPKYCLQLLRQSLAKLKITLPTDLDEPGSRNGREVEAAFTQLTRTKGWANGRDVETIAKGIIGYVFEKAGEEEEGSPLGTLCVSFEELMKFLGAMLKERGGMSGHHIRSPEEIIRANNFKGRYV